MVKEGSIVIDVGISKSWTDKAVVSKQRFVGDVDFEGIDSRILVSIKSIRLLL